MLDTKLNDKDGHQYVMDVLRISHAWICGRMLHWLWIYHGMCIMDKLLVGYLSMCMVQ